MSRLDRALKLFSAMEKLPDEYIRSAEETLAEAEAGISRPAKPMGVLRRFVNSGWGAAVISGTVAAAVLLFVVQMGRDGGGVSTDQMPSAPIGGALEESSSVSVGSSIEESAETVNYTLSTEYTVYGQGTMQITAIVAAKNPGEPVSLPEGWYLERVTEEGVEFVHVYYTEEASTAVPPDENSYASLMKNILIDRTPLTEGVYNLHATKYDGEKYVSVAKCSFIVGCETPPPLATTDPNRMVVEGVFFWANGEPFVNLPSYGNPYPVHLAVENEAVDLSDLTSGDAVVLIIANRIEETYPCRGRLYEIRKTADGSMEDLPAWMIESLEEMGYTVTETATPDETDGEDLPTKDFSAMLEGYSNDTYRSLYELDGKKYGRIVSSSDSPEDAVRVCSRHFTDDRYPQAINAVVECAVIYESEILYGIHVVWEVTCYGEPHGRYEENVISFKKSAADVTVRNVIYGDTESFALTTGQEEQAAHILMYLFYNKYPGRSLLEYSVESTDHEYRVTAYSFAVIYGDWGVMDEYQLLKHTIVVDKTTGGVTFAEPVLLDTLYR